MNSTRALLRAIRGPIVLITLGTLFVADFFGGYSFWRTWPILLIVLGVLLNYTHFFSSINLGRLPGGLLVAITWANVLFGAVSGSSAAAAQVFVKIGLPEMDKLGYDRKWACGGIATASIIATLIPPSILMVIYGILTDTSVAKLLLAGAAPGVLLAIIISGSAIAFSKNSAI
jgi:TRAP-type C4-dicarboxylate transport system permease large subunit